VFLDKTPISIGSFLPQDQSAMSRSNQQLDMHYDALEDEDNNDNNEEDGYDDDETSDDQDELEDDNHMDTEDSIKSPVGTCDQPENIMLPLPSHLGFHK
jgi:hypothetical protein